MLNVHGVSSSVTLHKIKKQYLKSKLVNEKNETRKKKSTIQKAREKAKQKFETGRKNNIKYTQNSKSVTNTINVND